MAIKAIIGLGNPGNKYAFTRHNIGFMVLDQLAQEVGGTWHMERTLQYAVWDFDGHTIYLIKPQTYMNDSGNIAPWLRMHNITPQEIIVVHDELEKPFGTIAYRIGGSARGHNGLKSLIGTLGEQFGRLRCGIGRPLEREQVPEYVLSNFTQSYELMTAFITRAIQEIKNIIA
ncbi:aminoacyl-tRNA hydrolase [Candidatus Dependentiae bacterium]|nr:aminoacyl-tRNA hydrolase [Candidatus Dependentiae bacterium]